MLVEDDLMRRARLEREADHIDETLARASCKALGLHDARTMWPYYVEQAKQFRAMLKALQECEGDIPLLRHHLPQGWEVREMFGVDD